ncbi:NAD(P)/FAD-dependent oxidoreductase [Sphingomonas sp. SUN019]|uniref:flavin-containing monooxygenase n=1 Tax=Sphingomonas sp. SUN019 TaxID=2937788 RepID=UPI002164C8CF|nr:NAD(P)/FAD-dependent oxidoreductase [Sphingomonas sp. SUN019]UVO50688.1 NAD(P)/FAD-dependent oxidoreductase [Sphingomonas sp. SUN019]
MSKPDTLETRQPVRRLDALVIGMGFGGMYALHRTRGMGLDVLGIEAGDDVGGTWYWNRYPGARCDVMSIDYSYSFSDEIQQEWTWSEQFSAQPEILSYARFVADKLDLKRDIRFETRATRVAYDDDACLWRVETDRGDRFEATYLLMATGPLSVPKPIDIPGADMFKGELHLSGKYPHRPVDLSGKRVAVIGTGSSGIQIVPVVAEQADHLYVFQRTPSFTLPMRNRPLDAAYVAHIKQHYPGLRAAARYSLTGGSRPMSSRPLFSIPPAEREELLEEAWAYGGLRFLGLFSDLLTNAEANEVVAEFVRGKIAEVVEDPDTARRLTPQGYPIFARRPCLDSGYYEAFNRDNVTLMDCLEDPITAFTETGIRTATREVAVDVVIAATGYDALTGAMLSIDITGKNGRSLKEKWADGGRSYLGLAMEGFPNLFIIAGANGPSALANFILLNEQNVDWICDCIDHLRTNGLRAIEADGAAEDRWMRKVTELGARSLYPTANTWYTGANVPGKPRTFPVYIGGLGRYREICTDAATDGYAGFHIV